jgi:crotonobetainyl-CoA:carnitine CoA-transferase CaiB-like acyl-CoA transferase
MVTRDTATWAEVLGKADIMCTPVVDYEQLVADPQLQENEMLVELPHARGSISSVGVPIKLSETPGSVRTAGPLIGEHSRELLIEAGYTAVEINGLLERGIVSAHPEAASGHEQTTPTERA